MSILEIQNHRTAIGPTITTPEAVDLWVQANSDRIDMASDPSMFIEMAKEITPELCGYAMVVMAAQARY